MLTPRQKAAKQQARSAKREANRQHARRINGWFELIITKAKQPNATPADKTKATRAITEKTNRVNKNQRNHHRKKETRDESPSTPV